MLLASAIQNCFIFSFFQIFQVPQFHCKKDVEPHVKINSKMDWEYFAVMLGLLSLCLLVICGIICYLTSAKRARVLQQQQPVRIEQQHRQMLQRQQLRNVQLQTQQLQRQQLTSIYIVPDAVSRHLKEKDLPPSYESVVKSTVLYR